MKIATGRLLYRLPARYELKPSRGSDPAQRGRKNAERFAQNIFTDATVALRREEVEETNAKEKRDTNRAMQESERIFSCCWEIGCSEPSPKLHHCLVKATVKTV